MHIKHTMDGLKVGLKEDGLGLAEMSWIHKR
jgi:hypothetical protein